MALAPAALAQPPLDPVQFRRPRDGRPTRHIYLANCGEGCGDSVQSVLRELQAAAPSAEVQGLHVGSAGVSYVSFATVEEAELAQSVLRSSNLRWVLRFAESADDADAGPPLPKSVASTTHVEVPGLKLLPDFVSEAEAQELLGAIDARPWDARLKRRVQHYGHAFDYARLALAEAAPAALPEFCAEVLRRLGALTPCAVDQLTVNEYQPGVGIAFHVDAHSAFEDGIAALTLGAGIVMEFRPALEGGKVSVGKHHRLAPPPVEKPPQNGVEPREKLVWLPPNSLLLLRGESRYAWQHGIAWRKTDCLEAGQAVKRGRRVSLTFRAARHAPCDCRWPLFCDAQNPETHVLPLRLAAQEQQAE